jgi:hypothetical protein
MSTDESKQLWFIDFRKPRRFMKHLLTIAILTTIANLLIANTSLAAALCPPSSCNPHNGCVDGCKAFTVAGQASCSEQKYESALLLAKNKAQQSALQICQSQVFRNSEWFVRDVSVPSDCQVMSSAEYLCLR